MMVFANNFTLFHATRNSKNPLRCSHGTVVPFVNEDGWSLGFRATLYFIALLYLFLGAAVVNDYVMASTSIITSVTKRIYLSKPPDSREVMVDGGLDMVEVRIWHETLIHLAFTAFSTSATEILLCTIEIVSKHFDHGELGPGLIVGSAAFNMLIITSICMVSLPGNDTRRIEGLQVYYVSIFFSVAGYGWILVLIYYVSPEVITLWESLVTALMFPVFIFVVWLSHHDLWGNCCSKVCHRRKPKMKHHKSVDEKKELDEELLKDGKLDRENLAKLVRRLKRHSGLTDYDAATVAAFKLLQNQPHSILWYRIGGIRSLTGGYRNTPGLEARLQRAYKEICEPDKSEGLEIASTLRSTLGSTLRSYQGSTLRSSLESTGGATTVSTSLHNPNSSVVEFHSAIVAVQRTEGNIEVTISRYGNLEVRVEVRLSTIDGTAKKNRDYVPIDQILVFECGQREAHAQVVILNANEWEEDEEFFLRLSLIHKKHEHVELGRIYMMAVTIIDSEKHRHLQKTWSDRQRKCRSGNCLGE